MTKKGKQKLVFALVSVPVCFILTVIAGVLSDLLGGIVLWLGLGYIAWVLEGKPYSHD